MPETQLCRPVLVCAPPAGQGVLRVLRLERQDAGAGMGDSTDIPSVLFLPNVTCQKHLLLLEHTQLGQTGTHG